MSGYDGLRSTAGAAPGAEPDIERGLADLAAAVEIGPTPFDQVMAGGRRRLRRRRAVLGGAALVTAIVLGGGVLAGAGQLSGGGTAVARAANGGSGASTGSGVGPSASMALAGSASQAVRDPFTPVRVVVAQGTSGGQEWKAWAALWPAAGKEQVLRQDQLIWQEQKAAGSDLPEPTAAFAQEYWHKDSDEVNLYVTVAGRRLADDSVLETPPPAGPPLAATGPDGGLSGMLFGHRAGELADPVVMARVNPDVAKVVVTWQDGTTSEPALVTLGDSPVRWLAVAKRPGSVAKSFKVYGVHGELLGTNPDWLH